MKLYFRNLFFAYSYLAVFMMGGIVLTGCNDSDLPKLIIAANFYGSLAMVALILWVFSETRRNKTK